MSEKNTVVSYRPHPGDASDVKVVQSRGLTEEEKQKQFLSEIELLARTSPEKMGKSIIEITVNGKRRLCTVYEDEIKTPTDMAHCLVTLAEVLVTPDTTGTTAAKV